MLVFAVYSDGQLANQVNLTGAYLVGTDDVPIRADVTFKNGIVSCQKKSAGPAGLAILWVVKGVGNILMETVRVPERDKPYVLQVELARGRLMRIQQKIEEWGLVEQEGASAVLNQVAEARDLLITALQADSPSEAASRADQALSKAVQASEEMSRFHSEALLERRKQPSGFPRRAFGCSMVTLDKPIELARKRITAAFDFVTLPIVWRDIEPREQTFNWKQLDAWVEALAKQSMPIKGSALLSFRESNVPDWLYIWEHDFDTIRDLAFEHVRRVLNRYAQYVHTWDVISGIHANNCFTFNFEQLMELTRMATALTKQVSPNSTAIVDLISPWGEYYARNQRTIPPLLYADMTAQSGINHDAFGLQFHFGPGVDGMMVRDMFQISAMLDSYVKLGKPLHITAVQVPSDTTTRRVEGGVAEAPVTQGGVWHAPWSESVQAEWLKQFLTVALSKPFVESVSWQGLADDRRQLVPHGGLLRSDFEPKQAYQQLIKFRSSIIGEGRSPRN